jgi:hypothetical protein
MTAPRYTEERANLIARLESFAREWYRDVNEPAVEGDDRDEGDFAGAVEYWRTCSIEELRYEVSREVEIRLARLQSRK